LLNAQLQLRQDVQSSISILTSEFQRLTAAQTAAEQGREALRLANAAFGQGVASSQDVLNAQQARYKSESLLIESQNSYLTALLKLRKLMGVNLEKVYVR
jgi:outer membrane protein TolC